MSPKKQKIEENKQTWQEFVEANKDKPIGEMSVAEIVRFVGESDLLSEISENEIARAIEPIDYFFWRGRSEILDNFTTEDAIGCLDWRDFDRVMDWCDDNGDIETWIGLRQHERKASCSTVAASYIMLALQETNSYRYRFLNKKEAIEEITQIINDNWYY